MRYSGLFLALLFCLVPSTSTAALILSIQETSSANLNQLAVGQTLSFSVLLSGLPAQQELGYLAGTVQFDSGLFGSANQVTAGAIVPDLDGFLGVGASGLADASYDSLFSLTNATIGNNGSFYSFDLTVLRAGSGQIQFDPTSLAARDLADAPLDLTSGPSLMLTAQVSVTAVPEPATFTLLGAGLLMLSLVYSRTWAARCLPG